MRRGGPPVHKGYQGSCIQGERGEVWFGHVTNVRKAMISFRFPDMADYARALRIAVEHYLADCRLAGISPEKPIPAKRRRER